MAARVGILAFLHESNTFVRRSTTLQQFEQDVLVVGEDVRQRFGETHHEVGGFFEGLAGAGIEAVPLFGARALPAGVIAAPDYAMLVDRLLETVRSAGPLDGYLVAPHGATVSQEVPDADGHWLAALRELVGPTTPLIGTLDAHANLSPRMADVTDALIAYRSNPHLDQRARGRQAADLMARALRGEARPKQAAAFPPLAISIERQTTSAPHLAPAYEFADAQLQQPGVLANSILLGFPYADVAEMGTSTIVVTDGDAELARRLAAELAGFLWEQRLHYRGQYQDAATAVARARELSPGERACLLDMGDNVGGGSPGDGTTLLAELLEHRVDQSEVCLCDPQAVVAATAAGVGNTVSVEVGGKADDQHGPPVGVRAEVQGLYDGKFQETRPRHGGFTRFDQGPSAVLRCERGPTILLTTRRMTPFSLNQLISCGLDPASFRILVAKGVIAPVAAYEEVCQHFIRVDTPGSSRADMTKLDYHHRRRPMEPFEPNTTWTPVAIG